MNENIVKSTQIMFFDVKKIAQVKSESLSRIFVQKLKICAN